MWQPRQRALPLTGEIGDGAAVHLVAIEAANLAVIHIALHEIVALHAVLVRGEIGEWKKFVTPGFSLLELPVIGEPFARRVANRPVVSTALNRILKRTALAVALHADVVAAHVSRVAPD